ARIATTPGTTATAYPTAPHSVTTRSTARRSTAARRTSAAIATPTRPPANSATSVTTTGWATAVARRAPLSKPPRYPQPGMVVADKYVVESVSGEGGMGAVLKAKHLDLDELVAIKCLLPEMMERPEIVGRFTREAKAAVKLKGEHVARVLDVGRLSNGVPF